MLVNAGPNLLHWNYFIALESDLSRISRYVEFSDDNKKTYSIELAHLLFASASECDVVLKALCKKIDRRRNPKTIDSYREILVPKIPALCDMMIRIPRYGLQTTPWEKWKENKNPNWWRAYNNVKHERNRYFSEATLQHTIDSLSGLLAVLLNFYKEEAENGTLLPTTELLAPAAEYILGVGPSNFGNSVVYRLP